ncbi:MAG: type II toxin-antitoxin system RelE/ParE family toxin [Burkholderiales bacterium]|nr:type II toxin-antitoxin system RelE/ParE family toxin [Phycisphaerae bacterium]
MKYRFHAAARIEFLQAVVYYESHRSGLGEAFEREVYSRIQDLLAAPHSFPSVRKTIHRCATRRFPYAIVYSILPKEVIILAVAHQSRLPGYWRRRTSN